MKRILVVDDSLTSRAIAVRLLEGLYEVEAVGSGPEALEKIALGGFDLLLLDLLMPSMDGQTVLAELQALGSKLPTVVISADIQTSTKERILALGATAMVNKPMVKEALVAAIEAAIQGGKR